MELKYGFVIYIGLGVLVLMILFLFLYNKRGRIYKGGKKIVHDCMTDLNPVFRRRKTVYRALSIGIVVTCLCSMVMSFILIARPNKTELETKYQNNRDIILVMDISTSVDFLNMKLVDKLKNTVKKLKGERIGIEIFNTSTVMLTPLTDDYEFVLEQLDTIKQCLETRNMQYYYYNTDDYIEDYFYYDQYITSGTLLGAEQRGSSLIGDGLAAAINNFTDDKDRTKIVIFSSDNDLQGEPLLSLSEAGRLCKESGITVYGIGTREMRAGDQMEMKATVEDTGGKFFLEEGTDKSFDKIVSDIDKMSKNKVEGGYEVKEVNRAAVPFIILLGSIMTMFVLIKVTRR